MFTGRRRRNEADDEAVRRVLGGPLMIGKVGMSVDLLWVLTRVPTRRVEASLKRIGVEAVTSHSAPGIDLYRLVAQCGAKAAHPDGTCGCPARATTMIMLPTVGLLYVCDRHASG
jgi:hypothetical protein